jgi:hypothetical protein
MSIPKTYSLVVLYGIWHCYVFSAIHTTVTISLFWSTFLEFITFLFVPLFKLNWEGLQIIYHYSPFWTLTFHKGRLTSILSPPRLLLPLFPRICNASVWTTSFHLIRCFPTDLLFFSFPLRTFYVMCPTHPGLLISIATMIFRYI